VLGMVYTALMVEIEEELLDDAAAA